MKLKSVRIKNFRGYKEEIRVDLDDLTTIVGKNDIGKSTILEALDIFFNDGTGVVKIEKDDINKEGLQEGNDEITISVLFEAFPSEIIVDTSHPTKLSEEYLLTSNGQLEIIKKYPKAGKAKIFIRALHPTNQNCNNLHQQKNTQLKTIVKDNNIHCDDLTRNAVVRTAIWEHFKDNLELEEVEIEVSKEDAKNIWEKLKEYLPLYTLFQADRKNSDGDDEVQDPLKFAVKEILKDAEILEKLQWISEKVKTKLNEVSEGTLKQLNQMNSDIADSLIPNIPTFESLKWNDVFKNVTIAGDEGVPINKRGSGVKRLILISFFRAEAIRKKSEESLTSIIYAIEEPETSQHFDHQKKLVNAFLELSNLDKTQVLLTTHSSVVVKEVGFDGLRLIVNKDNQKQILPIEKNRLPYPSLNEVNFLALGEVTEEYHNELYEELKNLKAPDQGIKQFDNSYFVTEKGEPKDCDWKGNNNEVSIHTFIRNQIHHRADNGVAEFQKLKNSIIKMRQFLNEDANYD